MGGLPKKTLDFVLAATVVFGSDPRQWNALVETIKAVSGSSTLVVVANRHKFPASHPSRKAMDRGFYKPLLEEFEVRRLPQNLLHPSFHEDCPIQLLRRKEARILNRAFS